MFIYYITLHVITRVKYKVTVSSHYTKIFNCPCSKCNKYRSMTKYNYLVLTAVGVTHYVIDIIINHLQMDLPQFITSILI